MESGDAFLIVDPWEAAGNVGRCGKWRRFVGRDPEVWSCEGVELAAAWYAEGVDHVVVLSQLF